MSGMSVTSNSQSPQKGTRRVQLVSNHLINSPTPPQPTDDRHTAEFKMKLLYPTSLALNVQSLEGFSVDLQSYDVKKEIPAEHLDADVLVTWTNTPENLKHAASNLKQLKWIQSLAAGPNDVLGAGFDPSKIAITTGSGLHDATVAEHALGLLLASARKFHEMRDYQTQGKWPGHLGGPQPDRPKGAFTTLRDANVLIWGFGNIAKTLTPYLTALGANVSGVARSAGVRNGITIHSQDDLPSVLPDIDALVIAGRRKSNRPELKMAS